MKKYLSALVLCLFCFNVYSEVKEASITVFANQPKGEVNRNIYGSEFKCFEGCQGLMTGLYDKTKNEYQPSVIGPIQDLGPTFIRYKYMRGRDWCWTYGIGPMESRKDNNTREKYFGIDEMMKFQKDVKSLDDYSKCILVANPNVDYIPQNMALVAYLNIPVNYQDKKVYNMPLGKAPNGIDYKTVGYWAELRSKNGHPEPFGVKYFEIGNETYQNKEFHGNPKKYCTEAKKITNSMKKVDPSILCGVNFEAYPAQENQLAWREGVIKHGGKFADFFVCHMYYPCANHLNRIYGDKKELYFKMTMAGAEQAVSDLRYVKSLMNKYVPERADKIQFCLTENGFHPQDKESYSPAWQNTVLAGVYDADEIGKFVEHQKEFNIACANLFYLTANDNWSFIYQNFSEVNESSVTLQSPYYSLYMWTHYFGDTLTTTQVQSGTFDIENPKLENPYGGQWPSAMVCWSFISEQKGLPLVSAYSSLSKDGKKLYLMVINRDLYNETETEIKLEGFKPATEAQAHTLGTSVRPKSGELEDMIKSWESNNLENPDSIKIRDSKIQNASENFKYTFPAYTATALVFEKAETVK
ncbi:MAG: hypothetical protein A3J83_04200 [Elusimicrobia bacterium RIFOXYA2_FULL_40_6]|nr:MAG: hypothetical protein A3J83_04200 [Elusimicrobia bacterium RIFOXYA2_FULL_40_6]